MGAIVLCLILFASRLSSVICDGAAHANTSEDSQPAHETHHSSSGTVSSVHTTSTGDGGHQETFSSILSTLNPDIISSLARNPQIAQALRSSGVDVGAGAAAAAAAHADDDSPGGPAVPPPAAGAGFPSPLGGGFPGIGGFGGLPYGGGGFPFFGGPFKQLHVSGDFGLYYPVVEKVIIVVGGGILILVILALLTKGFAKGGMLYNWGSSLSEALAGSASVDVGPFHKSVAGAAAVSGGVGQRPGISGAGAGAGAGRFVNSPQGVQLTQRVYDGFERRY